MPTRSYTLVKNLIKFKIPEDVIKDFQLRNEKRYKINRFYEFKVEYILISQNELDEIFDKGVASGWHTFDSLYTNSTGRIYYSRFGFNNEKDEALLYYDIRSGGLSGAGYFIYLRKENGKWKDVAWAGMWVS